jgi:hypothetical protein
VSETPTKPVSKLSSASTPCVCCRLRAHDGIPDADLEGYVCRSCKRHLRAAEAIATAAGLVGCVPDPTDPK